MIKRRATQHHVSNKITLLIGRGGVNSKLVKINEIDITRTMTYLFKIIKKTNNNNAFSLDNQV